jgi:hypothetical protein
VGYQALDDFANRDAKNADRSPFTESSLTVNGYFG